MLAVQYGGSDGGCSAQNPSTRRAPPTTLTCKRLLDELDKWTGKRVTLVGAIEGIEVGRGKTVSKYVCRTLNGALEMDSGRVFLFGVDEYTGTPDPDLKGFARDAPRKVTGVVKGKVLLGLTPANLWSSPLLTGAREATLANQGMHPTAANGAAAGDAQAVKADLNRYEQGRDPL